MANRYKGHRVNRRRFLRGAGGVIMALPFLEGLVTMGGSRAASAAPSNRPVFFVAMRAGNGVAQKAGDEPERFWPVEKGQLTREMMQRTPGGEMRSTGELADYADDLLIVEGTKYNFPGNGCGHSGGGNQCLTNTPPSDFPEKNKSLATGESIDNFVQRHLNPMDPEPLTLMVGKTSGYLNEVLSFTGPPTGETNGVLRSAERNPWEIYKSLFGDPSNDTDDLLFNQLVEQRRSVNDLLREQIQQLERSPKLSQADRNRLELHQQSIRDLERRMVAAHLPETDWRNIERAGNNDDWKDASTAEQMLYMMNDITALAFATDSKRAVTIQVGNGNDQTVYDIDGPSYPFHWISHRIEGDGSAGSKPDIANADQYHYQIDRIQLRWFADLVGKLKEYSTDQGNLLDDCIALWTNDLSTGIGHGYRNLPQVIAGSGGGYLKTGVYVDARESGSTSGDGYVSHGQLFNTIINAMGVTKDDGSPVDDFGHKGGNGHNKPPGGEIPGIKA